MTEVKEIVEKEDFGPVFDSAGRPARSQAADEAGPARILVVDDQVTNIQIVGSVLGALGHKIIPASDGAAALEQLSIRVPDLILLDLLMPGTDGFEVCRRIKANSDWQDIPVIILSAADDKELIVRALNSGSVDYITKPFNHAELVSRVRTQLTLKKTCDRLAQIARDKDELMGILAHDLKNYLGGINMSAELLRGRAAKYNDERLMTLSEGIVRSSAFSLAFVKEYLANAATDSGFVPKTMRVNLVEVATTVVQQYQEAARRKRLEIETDFSKDDTVALADSSAAAQVLDNLVSNALKFSPPDKKIFVTVRPAGKQVECVIRDEGPGFSAEDKAKMFRRYGRLSARPTGGEPSTGLGLSIVRKLVHAMNGKLRCESSVGHGATFVIRLPRPKN